jgi:uncharacterized protein DUF5947
MIDDAGAGTAAGTGADAKSGVAALRRYLQTPSPSLAPKPGERCDFCATPVSEGHGHVVSVETRRLMCACRPCYLLFTHDGAAGGKYRSVPDRYRSVGDEVFTAAEWEALQIPVGMVFVFFNTSIGRPVAFYPSPAGATESLLSMDAWDAVRRGTPAVATILPDVEALLVHRTRESSECFIVPIDACYELVGRMRRCWKGFDGGEDARREIEGFFATVAQRSTEDAPTGRTGRHE